jgi:hypothetical protein
MDRQRGFMLYAAIGGVAVLGAMSVALMIQSNRLETCKKDFEGFKLQTKAIGEAADIANRKKEWQDVKRKEKTDADHKRDVTNLNARIKRMRDDASTRSSLVPKASPASRSPQTACFDRSKLDSALRGFTQGVEGIVAEGERTAVEINLARAWAQRVYED